MIKTQKLLVKKLKQMVHQPMPADANVYADKQPTILQSGTFSTRATMNLREVAPQQRLMTMRQPHKTPINMCCNCKTPLASKEDCMHISSRLPRMPITSKSRTPPAFLSS